MLFLIILYISSSSSFHFAYGMSRIAHECYRRGENACSWDRMPKEIPDTVPKLEEACNVVPDHLECTTNAMKECEPDSNDTKYWSEVTDYLHSACDEDNPTFKTVKENVPCIAGSVKRIGDLCLRRFREGEPPEEYFRPIVATYFDDYNTLSGTDRTCLVAIYTVTCASLITGVACGEDLEEVAYDVGDNLYFHTKYCSPEAHSLKGTLRAAFRSTLNAEEGFVNSIGHNSSISEA